MSCEESKELEKTWKTHYETATYFDCSEAIALPLTKKMHAQALLAHRQNCSTCREKQAVTGAEDGLD